MTQLIQIIAENSGKFGWYQLDREINPKDVPDGKTVMDLLNELEFAGLILSIPSSPQRRYVITDAGRAAMTTHEKEE